MTPPLPLQSSSQGHRRASAWSNAARAWLSRTANTHIGQINPSKGGVHTQQAPAAEPLAHVVRRHELVNRLSKTLIAQPTHFLPHALACFDASRAHIKPAPQAPRHAIVVLGIAVFEDDAPNPHFAARVAKAQQLTQRYPDAAAVVTGAHVAHPFVANPAPGTQDEARIEAKIMHQRLVQMGVPAHRVLVEPHARHTVANLAYGYQKIEAELLPLWGTVAHLTVSMEPYHAVRALRIAAALVASYAPTTQLHVALAERVDAKLRPLTRREAKLERQNLCGAQAMANLNRCQNEKRILASGW